MIFGNGCCRLLRAKNRRDGMKHTEVTVNLLWQIWKNRNNHGFNQEERSGREVISKALQE